MLFLVLKIVLDPFALQMVRQRFSARGFPVPDADAPAGGSSSGSSDSSVSGKLIPNSAANSASCSRESCSLLRSGFGLKELAQQTLGAIQLRGYVDQHPLQRCRVFRKCFGIDGQAQV